MTVRSLAATNSRQDSSSTFRSAIDMSWVGTRREGKEGRVDLVLLSEEGHARHTNIDMLEF